MSREALRRPWLISALASFLLFLAAAVFRLHPGWLDLPTVIVMKSLIGTARVSGPVAAALSYPNLEGIIVLSLIWYCWFAETEPKLRARLLSGVAASVLAGVAAFALHRGWPVLLNHLSDTALERRLLAVFGDVSALRARSVPDAPAFPSERACMFAGLAITMFLVRLRAGLAGLISVVLIEASRVYLGLHHLTDIIGSFSLSFAFVALSQARRAFGLGYRIAESERLSVPVFYMTAFFVSFEMATAFRDFHDLADWLLH